MKRTFTILTILAAMILTSSCGRTIYRKKRYNSNKFAKAKQRYHFWHKHGAMPRQHAGGYW